MAILRNGEKYACLTCIKGHRVAGCNHNDRDLVLVRRRGRPSTQCEHCRRLRTSSRKVHTKCTCGSATASTNDSMYNGDENNGINSNADNIYYAGVATNNQINNQVNNQVNNVETKSIGVNVAVQKIVGAVPSF
ncbi:copper fist DNA binding domain-containing protein [Syncephalis fuscata]|nr:copper fist DNA binding domain-containing protein [Syncephalis fuscata]